MREKKLGYSSQMALVVSLIAGSVGTGNIWRFPRVVAMNGGGAFILAWLVMLFLVCVPIMIGEHVIGRAARHGTPGAFRDFIGKRYTWLGTVVAVTMAGVAAYYSSVIAWVFYYLGLSLTKGYYGVDKLSLFHSVSNGNIVTVILFVIVLLISAWIAYKGVSGIEKANKLFIPVLFGCLVASAIHSAFLPGAVKGMNYLFSFEARELLNYKIWLEALTQAVWSAGPGWGLCITLAVFSKANSDVALTSTIQGLGDASASVIAGLAVIPAVFALSPSTTEALKICGAGNNGLTFISMTSLFEQMPGGYIVSILFFISLLFAALSSNVCHFMIVSLPFVDSGISRKRAVTLLFFILLILGLPSAWNSNFLTNQDWVYGQMMLIGALFSCFALAKFGVRKIRTLFLNTPYTGMHVSIIWELSVKFIAPLIVLIMFSWWSVQSIGWVKDWWNPLAVDSLGTFIAQGFCILIVCKLLNNKVADSVKEKYFNGETFPEIPDNEFSA